MNVFSTDPALRALAAGLGVAAEPVEVAVGDLVIRTIVAGGRAVTSHPLVDFFEPVERSGPTSTSARFVPRLARTSVGAAAWPATRRPELEPAPFVDWTAFPTWADYERLVKERRSNLWADTRRRARKLASMGGEMVFDRDDRSDEAWERCIEWKIDQYARTGAPDHLAPAGARTYLTELRRLGLTRVSSVRAGDRLVASHIGLHHEGRWYYWFPAFDPDPELQPYSPGRVLLHEMLRCGYADGDREFDFLFGDEDYKWYYATGARIVEPYGSPTPVERLKVLRKSLPRRYPKVQERGQAVLQRLRRWKASIR